MAIFVRCWVCGHLLKTSADFAGRLGECPFCGRQVDIPKAAGGAAASSSSPAQNPGESSQAAESTNIENFLDPPSGKQSTAAATVATKNMIWRRMLEALLDPRSIQWMLTIGGGLCVLGLIVWLVSLGVFETSAYSRLRWVSARWRFLAPVGLLPCAHGFALPARRSPFSAVS